MKKPITQEQYNQHDCHLSQDGGCEICEQYLDGAEPRNIDEDYTDYQTGEIENLNQ